MAVPLRLLSFSTLYPNRVDPSHGIFVETRLRQLLATGEVQAKVVAPVPWFPSRSPRFGRYAQWAQVPRRETHNGVDIRHPRYFVAPKIGMSTAPVSLAWQGLKAIRQLQQEGFDFDLIDAHYYYPDGVAAAWIARRLGKPLVISARGTDLNLIPAHRLPRKMIQWAERQADASITVCEALRDTLLELGGSAAKTFALRNGVDLARFRPLERDAIRARLDVRGPTLLSVGHLIRRKGNHLLLDALPRLPGWQVLLAGDGPEQAALTAQAQALGVADRVRFLGRLAQSELVDFYNAADLLVLASSREGMANVLLESLACGTPVVASRVWGSPEVVADPVAGRLLQTRDGAGIAATVQQLANNLPARTAVRRYAEGFDWPSVVNAQLQVYRNALAATANVQSAAA